MKKVYNTGVYSGLKYDLYCQGYIHYSNRRHTQKITSGREKVLTLQNLV